MYVLVNLNRYVGGGETLTLRFARYLAQEGKDYVVLVANDESWLKEKLLSEGLKYICWPVRNDSTAYFNISETSSFAIADVIPKKNNYKFFTVCLRDYYNVIYMVRTFVLDAQVLHGIYHPEDYQYLASLSLSKNIIYSHNRNVLCDLFKQHSLLFVNHNGFRKSIPNAPLGAEQQLDYIPLPVDLPQQYPKRECSRVSKIVMISRLVDFKIGAVVQVMRYVLKNKSLELTLIGHGPYLFLIRLLASLDRRNRISIITNASVEDIEVYTRSAHIGVAQGTSIVEMARFGIPVIVAPYSNISDIWGSQYGFLGLFGDIKSAELGDIRASELGNLYNLEELISSATADYKKVVQSTLLAVKSYDVKSVGASLLSRLENAGCAELQHSPPRPPLIKKIFKKLGIFR